MSSLAFVHLVYNALWDVPSTYSLCTHSLSELFSLDFGELYRYVQKAYENALLCKLFAMEWGTPVNDIGLVHLVYEAVQDLPVWYYLCTHSLSELFGSGFGELYRYVQKVYKSNVHHRL